MGNYKKGDLDGEVGSHDLSWRFMQHRLSLRKS